MNQQVSRQMMTAVIVVEAMLHGSLEGELSGFG
jgi:hypothetical protein